MSITVTYLNSSEANVGKLVKSTKKKYSWTFSIESEEHCVELFHSRLPNKQKVFLDRHPVSFSSPYHGTSNEHNFKIKEVLCTLRMMATKPALIINGVDFEDIKLAVSFTAPLHKLEAAPKSEEVKADVNLSASKENRSEAQGLGFDEWDRRLFESTSRIKKETPKTPVPAKNPDVPVKAAPRTEVKSTSIPADLFSPVQPPAPAKPIPQFPQANLPVFQIKNLEPVMPQAPAMQPFYGYPMMWGYRRA